jgi:site-specific recombinase XerD
MSREGAKSLFHIVAREAGIALHSIHDLRHSLAQQMADSGEPQVRIAGWLRRRDPASASRYVSTSEQTAHGLKTRDWYQARRTRR